MLQHITSRIQELILEPGGKRLQSSVGWIIIILQPLHKWDEDHVHLLTTSKVPHMPPGVELMSQFHLFEEMLVKLEQEAAGEEGGPISGPVSGSNSGTDRRSYEDEDFRMCKL